MDIQIQRDDWILEKTLTARIDDLDISKLLLKLIRNGRSELTVDFEAPPWLSTSVAPLDLAIIGDTPYGAAQIEDFPNLLCSKSRCRASSLEVDEEPDQRSPGKRRPALVAA